MVLSVFVLLAVAVRISLSFRRLRESLAKSRQALAEEVSGIDVIIFGHTHQDLPDGFQTAEFLEEHGLIDLIVHRKKMRAQISQFLSYFSATQ